MAELDIEYIKLKIKEVLKNAHTDSRKHGIKELTDRLNFSCPICGDSEKDPNKKRANIYKDNPLYLVCFNEGCRSSITKLFRDFKVDIDPEKKQQIYDYAESNIKFDRKKEIYIPSHLDKLMNINEMITFFNDHPEHKITKFKPIQNNSAAYQYLKYDRLIENFENIYEAEFKLTDRWIEKCIVILNKSGDKVLGFQIRNLKSGDKRLFKVYNFEKIYKILHPDEDIDELELMSYNKISNFYNILNVNWDEPVTIFEGYLDSIFFPNSIGAIGLNSIDTELSFLFDSDLDLQFFFDQDNVGVRKSSTLLENGHKVFLWQKLVETLLKNKTDKYTAKKYLLKIKDLNKLVQEMKNTDPYNKLKLDRYFSSDSFDNLYLDFTLYPKNQKEKFKKNEKY